LHVVIARECHHRGAPGQLLQEPACRLEFAVARALGEVTGYDNGAGRQSRKDAVHGIHHGQVAVPAEMEVGEVNQRNRYHHTARML
jgi:hypothetical protein